MAPVDATQLSRFQNWDRVMYSYLTARPSSLSNNVIDRGADTGKIQRFRDSGVDCHAQKGEGRNGPFSILRHEPYESSRHVLRSTPYNAFASTERINASSSLYISAASFVMLPLKMSNRNSWR